MGVLRFTLAALAVCALSSGGLRAQEGGYSPNQVVQMVAPIALYPDALTTQILMAATYPNDVADAYQWVQANRGLTGSALDEALASASWDPSVIALCKFPSVLDRMARNMEWTADLGSAFANQQAAVLDSIQELRRAAYRTGHLRTSSQQRVVVADQLIQIEPAYSGTIYVPAWDPMIVYGSFWRYPTFFYPSVWVSGPRVAFVDGFAWGVGFAAANVLFGGLDWHHHNVFVNSRMIFGSNIFRNTEYYHHRDRYEGHARERWTHNVALDHHPADFHRAPYAGESHGAIHGMSHVPMNRRVEPRNIATDRHAGSSGVVTERHVGPGGIVTERHAGSGGVVTERHAGSGGVVTERHGGSGGVVTERHAGSGGVVTERHAGSGGIVTERHAGSGGVVTERHAGSGGVVTERHAGSGGAVTERHAGSGGAVTERHVGSGGAVTERHVGSGGAVTERHVGAGNIVPNPPHPNPVNQRFERRNIAPNSPHPGSPVNQRFEPRNITTNPPHPNNAVNRPVERRNIAPNSPHPGSPVNQRFEPRSITTNPPHPNNAVNRPVERRNIAPNPQPAALPPKAVAAPRQAPPPKPTPKHQ